MPALRQIAILILGLSATSIARPLVDAPRARVARSTNYLSARQQEITEPVSFQRVTTSQSTVGTITETCQITLTPIDDDTVRRDKSCTYVVTPIGGTPPPPPDDNQDPPPGDDQNIPPEDDQDAPPPEDETTVETGTDQGGETATGEDSEVPTASEVLTTIASDLVGGPPAAPTGADGATSTGGEAGTGGAPPPIVEVGTGAIPVTQTAGQPPASTGTDSTGATDEPQQQNQEEEEDAVPGRKLEVLPIGLGVFAGISVIALIVVGLVTYERTKYRKAFRQRKLAEAGANMGYGGMAERT